jgi:hypothetical protein
MTRMQQWATKQPVIHDPLILTLSVSLPLPLSASLSLSVSVCLSLKIAMDIGQAEGCRPHINGCN